MSSEAIGWIVAVILLIAGAAAGSTVAFYRLTRVLAEMEHRLAALLVAPAPAPLRPAPFPPPMPFRPAFAPAPPEQAPQVARTPARPATVPPPPKPQPTPSPQPHRKHPGAHREEHHSHTQAIPTIKPAEEGTS